MSAPRKTARFTTTKARPSQGPARLARAAGHRDHIFCVRACEVCEDRMVTRSRHLRAVTTADASGRVTAVVSQ